MSRRRKENMNDDRAALGLVVFLFVYVMGCIFFSHSFYPGTSLADMDISMKTVEKAQEKFEDRGQDYAIAIIDKKGKRYEIEGKDIDFAYDTEEILSEALKKQGKILWPVKIFMKHELEDEISVSYDTGKLKECLESLELYSDKKAEASQNAYITYEDGAFVIIPEETGAAPFFSALWAKVEQAISSGETEYLIENKCYEQPWMKSDDPLLQKELELYKSFEDVSITYEFPEFSETVNPAEIFSWIEVTNELEISFDEGAMYSYVQTLANRFNTYGAKRSFTTTSGKEITIGGGDYGWVISKAGEVAKLKEDILNRTAVTREPVWEQKAFHVGEDDIGDTYIEIDYTGQHFYYYKEGHLILDSDIVSGNLGSGNGSPDGIFKINNIQKDITLTGEGYSSPVQYFMPFAYNVGFHDASWRDDFGGDIYMDHGSHGCINLPEKVAKKLYKIVEKGTPVIAYYSEEVELTSNNAYISNAWSYAGSEEEE